MAALKRKVVTAEGELEAVEFMALGAGNEVGRSCHIIKFKGKTIMVRHLHRIVTFSTVGLWYSPGPRWHFLSPILRLY